MALANAAVIGPSLSSVSRITKAPFLGSHGEIGSGFCGSSFCVGSHSGKSDVALERRKLKSVDSNNRIVENQQLKSSVEIPVSCYQLIGVPDRAEKDEIVKAVMSLKNAEIDEGYTMGVVASRQDLLMDVRDKLLFEPEYAGNLKEKIPPKSSLRIPWSWLPAALCLLQEIGESKLVLDIGRTSLQHQDAKPYADDLVLSMALAECTVAKIGFEKNKVSQGFEALARAQCLLRSKPSLAKMTLLSEIEESLEELAPACTLELLSMPNTPENVERRRGAIAALRELLRQGLDVEASCQVQDWHSFLSQAFRNLLANEIVDLLPWDSLAVMRKNKKTIESQNLRIVIDSNCFYRVFTAHMALGFSSKQKELINKAKSICECLITSEGIDLKFEEAFCLFLLGLGTEEEAVEKLKQLELNSNPKRNSVLGKAILDASAVNPSLELWLKDSVLDLYPDTKSCSPALANFFNAQKKFSGRKNSKGSPEMFPTICHRPLSSSGSVERKDFEEPRSSSPNLGFAVKQLTPTDLQGSLLSGKNENGVNHSEPSVKVKRNLSTHHNGIWNNHFIRAQLFEKITRITILGCIAFASIKLLGMNLGKNFASSNSAFTKAHTCTSWTANSSANYTVAPTYIRRSSVANKLKRIMSIVKMQFLRRPDAGSRSDLHSALTSSSSPVNVYRRLMPVEEAETLIREWQTIIGVVPVGPSGRTFNSSYRTRDTMEYKQELGNAIVNLARIVPDGLLVFFPSYYLLEQSIGCWKTLSNDSSSIWERICKHKKPVIEPRESSQFASSIKDYLTKLNDTTASGAVFFAVCRGKVSEGLDFADHAGRAVVVTGLPFATSTDPKVRLKREYLDQQSGAQGGPFKVLTGDEWYNQQASRAVNQAVGRVIRHRHDYGAIIFCDERFTQPHRQSQVSKWIQPHIKCYSRFGEVVFTLTRFFRDGRTQGATKLSLLEAENGGNQGEMPSPKQFMEKFHMEKLLSPLPTPVAPNCTLKASSLLDTKKGYTSFMRGILPANRSSLSSDHRMFVGSDSSSDTREVVLHKRRTVLSQEHDAFDLADTCQLGEKSKNMLIAPCITKKRRFIAGEYDLKQHFGNSNEQSSSASQNAQGDVDLQCKDNVTSQSRNLDSLRQKDNLPAGSTSDGTQGSEFLAQVRDKLSATEYIDFVGYMKALKTKTLKISEVLLSISRLFSGPERLPLLKRFKDYIPAKYHSLYEQYVEGKVD